ncbi:MAG: M23 family peptidase [Acidimicrobiia bacterium]|nr:M23 family peptidase [Acidimicrobiia bacterium]
MLLRAFLPVTALSAGTFALALFAAFPPQPVVNAPARLGADSETFIKAPLSIGHPLVAPTFSWLYGPERLVPEEPAADAALEAPARADYTRAVPVRAGDTFAALLARANVPRDEAGAALAALKGIFDAKSLKSGLSVDIAWSIAAGEDEASPRFEGLSFAPDYSRKIEVARTEDGGFVANDVRPELSRVLLRASGTIDSSLYLAGRAAGVPAPVLAELIRAYSYDVDFQREVQAGDSFEVVFESVRNEDGRAVHAGAIRFAALTISGARKTIWRHVMADGHADYFNDKGESVRKALLKTPIDGARLTSGFGKRLHPILGYTAMHRGVDFAAPIGTPIYAAGDGTVAMAEFNGAYGKYVRIRHNGQYATAYAHLSRFGRNIAAGKRVRQGDVIGYVGSTGRSTGPHLHYEILVGGQQTNPLKVKMPVGPKLQGADLARFLKDKAATERQIAEAELALPARAASARP